MSESGTTSEGTRALILAKAKELFAKSGFDGTSVRDIVNAAGVNVSLVSYHFGGKEGLYRECIKQTGTNRLTIARETLSAASTTSELKKCLQAYVDRSLAALAADLETQKIIALELDLNRGTFEDLLKDVFLNIHATVASFLAKAQEDGLIRKDLNPLLLAAMLQGLLINEARLETVKSCYFGASIKDETHRRESGRHIVELFINGVCN